MPTLETSRVNADIIVVSVNANELRCDGGKLLPYPTWIGTISKSTRKVNVWTPVGYVPRGYRAAALRLLEKLANEMEG